MPNPEVAQQVVVWDRPELLARHRGSASDWDSNFGNLGYVRGLTDDFMRTAPAPRDWLLVER